MGYTTGHITISVKAERHNGPQDAADNEAIEHLVDEVRMMVDADPAYRRVVSDVWGGV